MVGLSASLGVKSNLKQFQIFLGFFSEKWSKLQCFRFNQLRIFFECIFLKDFLKMSFFLGGVSLDYFLSNIKGRCSQTLFLGLFIFQRADIYGLVLLPKGHALRKVLGPVTPLGGLLFIAGWLSMAWNAKSNRRQWKVEPGAKVQATMEKWKLSACVR